MTARNVPTAEAVLVTSMMRALSIFRWVTLTWACVGLFIGRDALVRPALAVGLLALAAGLTLYLHIVGRYLHIEGRVRPERLTTVPILAVEIGLGLLLLVADGFVFSGQRAQSLSWAWPAAGIAAAGIAGAGRGWRHAGLIVAVVVGLVSLNTEVFLLERFAGSEQIGLAFSKFGLWLLVGLLVGPVMNRLLRSERLISVAKAREELARELHDGVLQTLALVQRRSQDPELAGLAREQENSLRTYLSDARLIEAAATDGHGSGPDSTRSLDLALRRVANRGERVHRIATQVVVAADCPPLGPSMVQAVAGAVGEALTNAAKHGNAERATIFAEPAEDSDGHAVFVSVHDNGMGFVVDEIEEGLGLSRSIRGRIDEQGGKVEVTSRPGKGTEVKLWI